VNIAAKFPHEIADSRKATGFVVTCEGKWQGQGPYYARPEHAQAEADWLTRRYGKSYGVEAVSTARCGLRHTSRIAELEAGVKAQRRARQRGALISKLVKRGYDYGDALIAAQNRFPRT
jgi:hypothetical protein